ncbi:unnamed protein product [Heligmosomoides polygyrus]|uniref:Cilia- and flagella-associated protein 157 n=1 Tax=Heligmosomoides polygyrus TaxID=6339 RepID=A0A3P7ZH56_HELPZ|nr:unnamed protein product [Heligmosomoides polygyrus]
MDSLLLLCRVDAFLVRGSGMFVHSVRGCVRDLFVAYAPTSDYDGEDVGGFYLELEKFYKEDHTFYKFHNEIDHFIFNRKYCLTDVSVCLFDEEYNRFVHHLHDSAKGAESLKTYLSELWERQMASRDDNENLEIARGAVGDPIRIGLSKDGDESFFARVNILKDKVAELALLDEQAADAHKKAAADNRTLNVAADMLKEIEDRQRAMLASNEHCYSEATHPVLSLRRLIAAIDARLKSKDARAEEKTDLENLARELRVFLTGLPDHGSYLLTHHSATGSPPELRVNFTTNNTTAESSSGISGSTVPTNETSSAFTTSSYPSQSLSVPTAHNMKAKAEQNSEPSKSSRSSSTTPI